MDLILQKLPCNPPTSEKATITIKNNLNIPITAASHPQLSVITVQPNSKTEVTATIGQTFQVTSQGQTRNVNVTKKNELLVIDFNKAFTDQAFTLRKSLSPSKELPICLYPLSYWREAKDIKSTSSETATGITFTNETTETVHVDWIDFQGKRQRFRTLKAQESYKQASFIGHIFEVVINGGKNTQLFLPTAEVEYIAYIGNMHIPALVPIQENTDELQSTPGGHQTCIHFVNRSGDVMDIFWIDFEGQPQLEIKLKKGGNYPKVTRTTHPWKVTAGSETTYYSPIDSDSVIFIE